MTEERESPLRVVDEGDPEWVTVLVDGRPDLVYRIPRYPLDLP